jgi:adenine-specific DNA-methyltransferase
LNIDELKKAFDPQNITETEHHEFRWSGKSAAKHNACTPTNATLIYDEQRSVNPAESENIIIEGENLEVLKLLSESYREQVKCIYIDPPYNTGGDFIYNDNYSENWLSMLYSRLLIARALLKSDGAIFISIGDEEYHNLRKLADEVFGKENYRNTFITKRYDKNVNRQFIKNGLSTFNVGFEYIVCYSKSGEFKFNPVYKASNENRQNFGYWKGFWNNADRQTMRYDILGVKPETGQWKWSKDRGEKAIENYKLFEEKFAGKMSIEAYWIQTGKQLEFIRRNPKGQGKNLGVEHWIAPTDSILRNTNWTDLFASKATPAMNGLFDFPKNVDVIKTLIKSCESNNDIILDFFAGSGSTGEAVFELNKEDNAERRFILVQLPEKINDNSDSGSGRNALAHGLKTISDITIERNRRVVKKIMEENKKGCLKGLGFKVFKLA